MLADRLRFRPTGPSATDPYWANVSYLLHMNGANGSTTFTDQKGHTTTANGNAQISTANSKFNGSSGLFDGSGDYLSTPNSTDFDIQGGDFTAEAWVYRNAAGVSHYLMSKRNTVGYEWRINASNAMQFFHTGGSSITSTGTIPASAWTHIAVCRAGSTVRQFINGALDATTATFTNGTADAVPFLIGVDSAGASGFNGNMAELRLTKGVGRYTSTFTPPALPFPNS